MLAANFTEWLDAWHSLHHLYLRAGVRAGVRAGLDFRHRRIFVRCKHVVGYYLKVLQSEQMHQTSIADRAVLQIWEFSLTSQNIGRLA